MKNTLIPELRADKDGKMVTRHVRADKGHSLPSKALPEPSLTGSAKPRKRRVYKPTESQLASARYAIPLNLPDPENWGPHVIRDAHPDLQAIPFTERQEQQFQGRWYRFDVNEVQYYSVMSVVRPFDAINLMHRDIKSADEARDFLREHGLEHLEADYSAYTDELLRSRIGSNMGMLLMNDMIDREADPVFAAGWAKMCAQKVILDKAVAIKDEMLSGDVTAEDLKAIGVKHVGADIKAVAEYIIHSKNDDNPAFTLEDIADVVEREDEVMKMRSQYHGSAPVNTVRTALAVARGLGRDAARSYDLSVGMHDYQLEKMTKAGQLDYVRLAELTVFATNVDARIYDDEDFEAMEALFDSGAKVPEVNTFLANLGRRMKASASLAAAREGLHTAVVDGWL